MACCALLTGSDLTFHSEWNPLSGCSASNSRLFARQETVKRHRKFDRNWLRNLLIKCAYRLARWTVIDAQSIAISKYSQIQFAKFDRVRCPQVVWASLKFKLGILENPHRRNYTTVQMFNILSQCSDELEFQFEIFKGCCSQNGGFNEHCVQWTVHSVLRWSIVIDIRTSICKVRTLR